MPPPAEPAPRAEESPDSEKEKGAPSRRKIGWSLCVLAIVLLTMATASFLHSRRPEVPLSEAFFPVVAAFWTAVVLGVYYWRSSK